MTNAVEKVVSSIALRCTSASANNAFTPTHSSTCTATAAAPMPTSAGPTRRATTNADTKESEAEIAASEPDQNTLEAWLRFMPLGGGGGKATAPVGAAT